MTEGMVITTPSVRCFSNSRGSFTTVPFHVVRREFLAVTPDRRGQPHPSERGRAGLACDPATGWRRLLR